MCIRDSYKNIKDKSITPFREIASKLGIGVNGLSGSVSLEDFNNDGRIDIFTTSYGMEDQCKLFFNTGYGFEDVTRKAGLNGIVSGLNCLHADYNNDGYVDILILRGAWLGTSGNHPNSLLRNNGDGTFSDVSKSSGILSFYPTQTASWADVNNDGYLDLFIGNESKPNQYNPCELFINQGNGKFLEQSKKYNLDQINGFVKGVAFGDINNDQWPDLFVSVLGGKNFLFKNEFTLIENYEKTNNKFKVEIHKKFTLAIACILFTLVGAPLGILVRNGGMTIASGLSIAFFLIYYILLIWGEQLADRNLLNPGLGSWLPNIILFVSGMIILKLSNKKN